MTELRRIVLARRPQGAPVPEDFRLETAPLPAPAPGEALARSLWLSLDPYMRGRMSEGPSYTKGVGLGEAIPGECVGEIIDSRTSELAAGDVVAGHGGWQSHFTLPARALRKLDPATAPVTTALGVLGMPGLTAYAGIFGVARPRPGETVVLGAASGAVGSVAGQLAKLAGAHVVGVAGGPEKCVHVERELGFACLDRKAPDLPGRLAAACPDGVDVYLELVGGAVTDAALPLLNLGARVPVIGGIAAYNLAAPPAGPDRVPALLRTILVKRLRVQGLLVRDWEHLEPAFQREVGAALRAGRIHYREDVVDGLEQAPAAFIGLLEGKNLGKLLVRVAS